MPSDMEKDQTDQRGSMESVVKEAVVEEPKEMINATEVKSSHPNTEEPEHEYITGSKLWAVLASVTLVLFLTLLDMSIIVTVSYNPKAVCFQLT
jgi:hypothetical protein